MLLSRSSSYLKHPKQVFFFNPIKIYFEQSFTQQHYYHLNYKNIYTFFFFRFNRFSNNLFIFFYQARILQKCYMGGGLNVEKLHAHVKATKIRIEKEKLAEDRRRTYRAAMLMQRRIRYLKAKLKVKKIKAAIHLQSFFRMCLARMERRKRYLVFCHETGMKYVVIPSLREAMARATTHIRQMQKYASTQIQTRWRIVRDTKERRERADYLGRSIISTLRIQAWWRHRLSDVIIANMTELAQCSKMNVFRDIPRGDKTKDLPIPSAHDLIVSAVKRINRYFR